MDYSFFWLPSLTRKRFPLVNWLDPSLKKVMKYFVVSLDKKFGCNVMNVCLLSWLGHTLALWFAKQDFLNKMTHRPSKAVSKNEKNLFVSNFWEDMWQILINLLISSLPKKPWSPDFSSPAASFISSSCTFSSTLWITRFCFKVSSWKWGASSNDFF